jgi:hypothetical protein
MRDDITFELAYDGEALKSGSIDVNDLAPSLLSLSDLIDESNKLITKGKAEIRLRVVSEFEKGSFGIGFYLHRGHDIFLNVFNSPEASSIATFLTIIGIAGGIGLFQLIKTSKGKKPIRITEITQTEKVKLEFENGSPLEVNKMVFQLFKSFRARRAVSRIIRPLKSKGINTLCFYHKKKETIKIESKESEYFEPPIEKENEIISESEKILQIISPSFNEENKWRVSDGNSTFYVSIEDVNFVNKIKTRAILFGNNDSLLAKLKLRQWFENGELKTENEIVEVINYLPAPEQLKMDFDGN